MRNKGLIVKNCLKIYLVCEKLKQKGINPFFIKCISQQILNGSTDTRTEGIKSEF